MDWKNKYLKYKNKYLELKYGGAQEAIVKSIIYDKQEEVEPCKMNYSNFSDIDFNYLERLYDNYKSDVNQPLATFHNFIEYMRLQLTLFYNNNLSTLTKKYFVNLFEEFREKADRIINASGIKINKQRDVDELKKQYITLNPINTLTDLQTIFIKLQNEPLIMEILPYAYPRVLSNKIDYWWHASVVEPTNKLKQYFNRLKLDPSTGYYIIQPKCQKIDTGFNIYFVDDTIKSIIDISTNTILPNRSPTIYNNLLLDPTKYINCIQNGIHDKLIDRSAICLEGNYVYADNLSKIASGKITSCLLMCIFFNDSSVFVTHFNGLISNIDFPYGDRSIINDSVKHNYTHENFLPIIKEKFKSVINNITKICLCGVLNDYQLKMDRIEYHAGQANGIDRRFTGIIKNWFGRDIPIQLHSTSDGHYIITNNNVYFIE